MLHLLTVESLPVYTFYISFTDLFAELIVFLVSWEVERVPRFGKEGVTTLGKYVYCLTNESFEAMFSFDPDYSGKCLRLDDQDQNYTGYMNVSVLIVCLAILAWTGSSLLRSNSAYLGSGEYLCWRWSLESSRLYSFLSAMAPLYALAVLAVGLLISFTEFNYRLLEDAIRACLIYQVPSIILLVLSGNRLQPAEPPALDYESQEFRRIQFRRTWWNVFTESDHSFSSKLEKAILFALVGGQEALEKLLEDPCDVGSILSLANRSPCQSAAESASNSDGESCRSSQDSNASVGTPAGDARTPMLRSTSSRGSLPVTQDQSAAAVGPLVDLQRGTAAPVSL